MGRKAKTTEEKRRPVSVSLSPGCIRRLDIMCEDIMSRSAVIEDALSLYWRFFQTYGPNRSDWLDDDDPQPPDDDPQPPDDVSEIGYDPYIGSYSEDL